MIVFAHLHKAAGTSVVNAAVKSGFRFPNNHANGHPLDSEGKRILLNEMPAEQIHALFLEMRDEKVEFMALEWGFPRFESFFGIPDLNFVTVLRDPVDRAISNYKMDLVQGYAGRRVFGFDTYTKQATQYCASNYYVRFFCSLTHCESLTMEHFEYTKHLLSSEFRTLILEANDLEESLCEMGFEPGSVGHDNALEGSVPLANYAGKAPLKVTDDDVINFISANGFDIALFRYFRRGGRMA